MYETGFEINGREKFIQVALDKVMVMNIYS